MTLFFHMWKPDVKLNDETLKNFPLSPRTRQALLPEWPFYVACVDFHIVELSQGWWLYTMWAGSQQEAETSSWDCHRGCELSSRLAQEEVLILCPIQNHCSVQGQEWENRPNFWFGRGTVIKKREGPRGASFLRRSSTPAPNSGQKCSDIGHRESYGEMALLQAARGHANEYNCFGKQFFFVLSGKIRLGCCGGLNEKGLIGSHIWMLCH